MVDDDWARDARGRAMPPDGQAAKKGCMVGIRRRTLLSGGLALPALLLSPARGTTADDIFTVGTLAAGIPSASTRDRARRMFERELDRPVRLRHFRSGSRLVNAAAAGTLQCSVHTALTFVSASLLCRCLVPVLRPVALDGAAGVRALLYVRRGSGVRSLADLRGSVVLGAEAGSVAGEVARRSLMRRFGIADAPFHDDEGDAIARFLDGEGKALVGYERIDRDAASMDGTHDLLREATGGDLDGFAPLWRSFPVWHGPISLASNAGIDQAEGRKAVTALVSMRPGGPALSGLGLGRVRMLVRATYKEYAPLVSLMRGS